MIIRGKDDFVAMIKQRRSNLGWSQIRLDHEAGLPDGYTGKLEASAGKPNSRSIGWDSLPKIMDALGLNMGVFPQLHSTCEHQDESLIHKSVEAGIAVTIKNKLSCRGTNGALAGHAKRNQAQRKAKARRAALARWKKRRKDLGK